MAILLLNTKVEIQKTLGTAKTITAISKATEAVITATHDFAVGDLILIGGVVGMTEINNRVVRVKSVSTTVSFVAEGLDSTLFTTYTSGGTAIKVTAFDAFDSVTSFSFPEPEPTRLPITTIHDNQQQEQFGLDAAPTVSMELLADPLDVAVLNMKAASLAKATRAFKVTLQNGNVLIFNAYVAGGRGIDGAAGDVAKARATITMVAPEQIFAV